LFCACANLARLPTAAVSLQSISSSRSFFTKFFESFGIRKTPKTCMSCRTPSPLDLFPIASVVEIHGLVSAPHRNGCRGVVVGATIERLSVQLEPQPSPTTITGTAEAIEKLAVKPSNVRLVPTSDISLALSSMSSWALNDRILELQSKTGTPGYNHAEHEALVKMQNKNLKRMTKARPHVVKRILFPFC
jgi:hypothetical protein